MNETTVFEKYEIPMEVSPSALESAVWVYEVLVQNLQAESVPTAEFESQVRQVWAKTDFPHWDQHVEIIRAKVWEIASKSGPAATQMFDFLGELRAEIKDERDYQVRMYARLNRPKAAVSSEFEEGKADAEELAKFIQQTFGMLKMMPTLGEVPATIKTKVMTDNSVKVNLSRLPNGPREGGGRKTATHNLRLIVDGEKYDLPVERVLHDVVSEGVNRVTVSDLTKAVGSEFSKGWSEPVILNGHSVVGFVESADSDSDEENSDDSNSESESE